MKNVFKLTALISAFTFAGAMAQASDNIAYVNPNYLLQNHPLLADPNSDFVKTMKAEEAKFSEEEKALGEEEKKLTEDGKKLQAEEKTVGDALKKKSDALEKEAPKLRSADIKKRQDAINAELKAFQDKVIAFQKREDEFRKKVEDFQQRLGNAQRELAEKQSEIQQNVIGEVKKAIEDTAQSKGYTLVLDATAVLYTKNEANDLTEEVYKALGGTIKPADAPKPAAK